MSELRESSSGYAKLNAQKHAEPGQQILLLLFRRKVTHAHQRNARHAVHAHIRVHGQATHACAQLSVTSRFLRAQVAFLCAGVLMLAAACLIVVFVLEGTRVRAQTQHVQCSPPLSTFSM